MQQMSVPCAEKQVHDGSVLGELWVVPNHISFPVDSEHLVRSLECDRLCSHRVPEKTQARIEDRSVYR